MAKKSVLARLDRTVDDFSRRTRYFHEEMTKGRARTFAMQHRLNTRQRNSVLKLKVAANCPDWETRIGLKRGEIRAAKPLPTTQLAWVAWEGLMANRHWLEGIVANTCAERANVPGYGTGIMKKHGWFGLERERWGKLFGLSNGELEFFELHEKADIEHSDAGWRAVERFAKRLHMEDAVVAACEKNLAVWDMYLDGIGAAGDKGGAPWRDS